MPALIFKGCFANFSFTFDGITIYPTFEYYQKPGLRNCLDAIQTACGKLDFVIKILPDEKPTKQNLSFIQSLNSVKDSGISYDRYVRRQDQDHALYHQDNFKLEASHWHIKFKNVLGYDNVNTILGIFNKFDLLKPDEKQAILDQLKERYALWRTKLNDGLTKDPMHDVKFIIEHVVNECPDIDILLDLHSFLLSPPFAYLRKQSKEDSLTHWQGTDASGAVKPCSKAWAMIEKNVAYRIDMLLIKGVTQFTASVGEERAKQFAAGHVFFAIKRKATAKQNVNKIYEAFVQGDCVSLEAKKNKLLAKM